MTGHGAAAASAAGTDSAAEAAAAPRTLPRSGQDQFLAEELPDFRKARLYVRLPDLDDPARVLRLEHEQGDEVGGLGFLRAEGTHQELDLSRQEVLVVAGQLAQIDRRPKHEQVDRFQTLALR